MKTKRSAVEGLTLLELLVVVSIIMVLAAMLLPALGRARAKAQAPACMNNLRQIGLVVRMYADDSAEAFPPATNQPPAAFVAYTLLMKSYLGPTGAKPERTRLFECPADTFYYGGNDDNQYFSQSLYRQSLYYYSSYAFNGGNFLSGKPPVERWPGIAGRKLNSIKKPANTVLVTEFSALLPFSWHNPGKTSHYNNSKNTVCFVDGHVSFINIYWNVMTTNGIEAWHYNPPTGYDYQWSGD